MANEIPSKTSTRSAKLASIPLAVAGRGALGFGRQLIGQSPQFAFADLQEKTAEQVFKVLGELKGGAMKFGQALSVFEAALPEDIAKPYRETLVKLQESAPPLPARRCAPPVFCQTKSRSLDLRSPRRRWCRATR